MGISCVVDGCLSSGTDINRNFYRFPKKETRCRQWIRVVGREDLKAQDALTLYKSCRICDLHFTPYDQNKKKLKDTAVPTLNLPQLDDTQLTDTESKSDDDVPLSATSTKAGSTKRKLSQNITESKQKKLNEEHGTEDGPNVPDYLQYFKMFLKQRNTSNLDIQDQV